MNICMTIAYDGSAFAGWQKNKNTGTKRALQDIFEQAFNEKFGQRVSVQAAGRTDAGVNAEAQVANFRIKANRTDLYEEQLCAVLQECLARHLREAERGAVVIRSAKVVPEGFHSRFDAVGKTYDYYIEESEKPGVFDRQYAYPAGGALDYEAMRKTAKYLIGEHDFAAFSRLGETEKDTVRRIREIRIEPVERKYSKGKLLRLSFTGDGFLYHMVRILAGTLLEAGQGKRTPESVIPLLTGGKRSDAGPLLYAEPLFLKRIYYAEKKDVC